MCVCVTPACGPVFVSRTGGPGCGPASQGLWLQCDFLWPLFGWRRGKVLGTTKGHHPSGKSTPQFALGTSEITVGNHSPLNTFQHLFQFKKKKPQEAILYLLMGFMHHTSWKEKCGLSDPGWIYCSSFNIVKKCGVNQWEMKLVIQRSKWAHETEDGRWGEKLSGSLNTSRSGSSIMPSPSLLNTQPLHENMDTLGEGINKSFFF